MTAQIASWNVAYTDTDGTRQRATGLADWDAARAEAARLRTAGARWVKTHPQFATLQDTFAYANRGLIAQVAQDQADEDRAWKVMYAEREAAQERAAYVAEMEAEAEAESLFIPELDGDTFASQEALADWHWDRQAELDADEYDADAAYERHLETNDQYRYEVEQDELRAAFFGGSVYYA